MRRKLILPVLALLYVFSTTGCGAKKSTNTASRGYTSMPSQYGSSSLAECNRINMSQFNLAGQIGTYYDPLSRQFRSDYLNVNLTSVPAELYTSSGQQIRIYRWSERTAGQKITNQVAVRLFFVDKLTGASTASSMVDNISSQTIAQARNSIGSTWLNVSTTQFFDRVMIVLTGMDLQYDAATFALYDTAVSANAISQADVLLPAFDANPNTYKANNPAPDLYTLHPNYSYIGSNATNSDYLQMTSDICQALSGVGTRIPASVTPENKFISLFYTIWNRILDSLTLLNYSL